MAVFIGNLRDVKKLYMYLWNSLFISKLETLRCLSKFLLTVSKMTRFLGWQPLKFVIVVLVLNIVFRENQHLLAILWVGSNDFLKIDLFNRSLLIYKFANYNPQSCIKMRRSFIVKPENFFLQKFKKVTECHFWANVM